jgi:hypothetical protein
MARCFALKRNQARFQIGYFNGPQKSGGQVCQAVGNPYVGSERMEQSFLEDESLQQDGAVGSASQTGRNPKVRVADNAPRIVASAVN